MNRGLESLEITLTVFSNNVSKLKVRRLECVYTVYCDILRLLVTRATSNLVIEVFSRIASNIFME